MTKPAEELRRLFPTGALADLPDERDYDLADYATPADEAEAVWGTRAWRWTGQGLLDQGVEGACASFAHANVLNCLPRKRKITSRMAFDVYDRVIATDTIPGTTRESQSGSYPRDNAKEYQRRGMLEAYAFTRDVGVMVRYLLNDGPIILSTDWLRSMDNPSASDNYYARVDWSKGTRGRHAYCICDIHWPQTMPGERYVVILNSWSNRYGYQGRARLSEAGLQSLIERSQFNQAETVVDKMKRRAA